MLDSNRRAIEAGVAVVALVARDKRPINAKWSTEARLTFAAALREFPANANIGFRLGRWSVLFEGYLHGIDIDIRDPARTDEAFAVLWALLARYGDAVWIVRSGSGGDSRHIYFVTDKPLSTRMLARSEDTFVDEDGKRHRFWEIELGGTGRQFVAPPSIHPKTGKLYEWEREPDWSNPPFIHSSVVDKWTSEHGSSKPSRAALSAEDDLAEFVRQVRNRPTDFEEPEILQTLEDLVATERGRDEWLEDREGWYKVGMALHLEYRGSKHGYEIWCDFASQSGKFDEKDSWRVWKSFGERNNPVTMRTIVLHARATRSAAEYGLDDHTGILPPLGDPLRGLYELYNETEADEQGYEDYKRELERNEDGHIKPTAPNLALMFHHDSRVAGSIALNDFTGQTVFRKPFGRRVAALPIVRVGDKMNGDLWQDHHDNALRMIVETKRAGKNGGFGMRVSDRDLKTAVDMAAMRNRFHPVRDYLDGLRWDGKPRLECWMHRYLSCPDNAYTRAVSRLMLIAAVVRAFEPGHKFDFACILEGMQGKRKSTLIKVLAVRDEWFTEVNGDFHNAKEMVEKMMGHWHGELPELSSLHRSDVNTTKSFISTEADNVRLAWGKRAARFQRQIVFWGSTNDTKYLKDPTGGRRWWVIRVAVEVIDTDKLRGEVDQLYAEAMSAYRDMRRAQPRGTLPLYLTETEAAEIAEIEQADRQVETPVDPYIGLIEEWVDTPRPIAEITGVKTDSFEPDVLAVPVLLCGILVNERVLGNSGVPVGAVALNIGAACDKLPGWTSTGRKRFEHISTMTKDKMGRQRAHVRDGATPREIALGYRIVEKKEDRT